jgi:PAS domain S-box-containing protein
MANGIDLPWEKDAGNSAGRDLQSIRRGVYTEKQRAMAEKIADMIPEELYSSMLESVQIGVFVVDTKGHILYINSFARNTMKLQADVSRLSVRIQDLKKESWHDFQKVIKSGKPELNIPVDYEGVSLVGHLYPFRYKGKIAGVVAVFKLLEDYEKLANDLFKTRESEEKIKAIIESSYDGIFVTDGQANTILANSAYEKITGLKASELVGRNMVDLVSEGYYDESVSLKVLQEKRAVTIPQTLKSGKNILVTGNPIFDEDGEIKMVVTNVRDMTDLVELQQQLEEVKGMSMAYRDMLKSMQSSSIEDNDIIMVSEPMLHVQELISRVCRTNATVLIYGETGVGKDRVAEEIHKMSERSENGILVKINCGAIPENLLESELFGYERGAFTGASREGKTGLFEVANNGTLFLDEIETMPLVLQSKLLRVLQNFEITRVGGTKPMKVDVRLICASNQDLKDLIDKKTFRADLYYRLNVIPIYIPPLRERRDDIPYLIHFFLNRYNRKHGKKKVLSREAMGMLLSYTWPGNVREVANVIERLVVITHRDYIAPGNLPKEIFERTSTQILEDGMTLKTHLESVELSIIRKAVEKYGSARRAAPHLGVDATTLTRKLKKPS